MGGRSLASRQRLTLAATVIGSSLAFIDTTVVIVALPTIEQDLGLGLTGQQWVYLSYSLALAAFYLVAGAVGDRFGRRATFGWGVAGFAVASALAGAAPDEAVLIVARTLQGVAGAFVTTNSLALLRATYGPDSGRAIGLWTSFTGIVTVAGPATGGALVEWVSWRWIFFLNLPLAVATIVLARAGRCREQMRVQSGNLDLVGAGTAAIGFGTLTYGVVEGAENGFASVWWALAVSAAAFAAFVVVERRIANPLLPFALFRSRNLAMANVETFLVYAALGGVLVYFTLYLQFLGFSPFEAGLANVPVSIVMILLAPKFGALADQRGPRLFLTAGAALIAAGILLFLPMDTTSGFWFFGVPGLALFSLGLACLVAPITSTALSSAPSEFAGIASGINQTVSRLGNLLAVAVIGLAVTLVFTGRVGEDRGIPLGAGQTDPVLRDASVASFRVAMLVAAGLAVAGAFVGWFGISDSEARARQDETAADQAIAEPGATS